tara:strand:- start:397 stop:1053 length:657 start_codon:yes stop_codon:yes gene_type:complete
MQVNVIGHSTLGSPIFSYVFGEGKDVLLLGGVHGDEIEGVFFAQELLAKVRAEAVPNLRLHIVPQVNPDGILLKQRANYNNIDLNRNLPTKDWHPEAFNPRYNPGTQANSEAENKALVSYLDQHDFRFLFSFHSFEKYLLNVNGDCEPYASILSDITSYPIEESMGYPTPGCLGTYTGLERGIPTITYELERGKPIKELLDLHRPAMLQVLNKMSEDL